MLKRLKFSWELLRDSFVNWNNSNAFRNSAGIAFYAIFSIPGLLIIIIWVAGSFFGQDAVRGEISNQISSALGAESAKTIENIIQDSFVDGDNFFMKMVGIGTLIFGATTLFFQFQKTLNEVWEIEPAPKKALLVFLLTRANSFGTILVIGFLLIVTMILSSIISGFNTLITHYLGFETYQLMQIVNFLIGFGFIMLVFAFMFKVLPDIRIPWKPVWRGSFITAILFSVGKFLLSYYFAMFKPTSAFGAVGTLALLMIWINYSGLLVYFGAEYTKVLCKKMNYAVEPSRFAKWSKLKRLEEEVSKLKNTHDTDE